MIHLEIFWLFKNIVWSRPYLFYLFKKMENFAIFQIFHKSLAPRCGLEKSLKSKLYFFIIHILHVNHNKKRIIVY